MTRKLIFKAGDFGDKLTLIWKVLQCWIVLAKRTGLPIEAVTMATVYVKVYTVVIRRGWTVWGEKQDGTVVQLNYVLITKLGEIMSEPQFVLQPWVATVGLKMQSILLSGLRAPDVKTTAIKKCVRWMRSNCQIDADPAKQSYMQTVAMNKELIDAAIDELEYLPCHYVHHFADAMAVMAYHHPDLEVQTHAYEIHYLVAEEIFHFVPESRETFLRRHKDKRGHTV